MPKSWDITDPSPLAKLNKNFGVGGKEGFKEVSPGVFHSPVGFSPEELKARVSAVAGDDPLKVTYKRKRRSKGARAMDPAVERTLRAFLREHGGPDSKLAARLHKERVVDLGDGYALELGVRHDDSIEVLLASPADEDPTPEDFRARLEAAAGIKSHPLHQDFYRMSFKDSTSRLGVPPNDPAVKQAQRNYQTMIRQAQRFVLTNDAMQEVYFLSQNIDKLYERAPLALAPFDTVWIEYDCHERVRLSREYGTAMDYDGEPDDYRGIPRRAGFLLKQLYPDRANAWVAFKVVDIDGGVANDLVPVGLLFDAESEAQMQGKVGGWETLWNALSLDLLKEVGMAQGVDHEKMQAFAWGIFNAAQRDLPSAPYLANMSAYVLEPIWGAVFRSHKPGDPKSADMLAKVLVESLREHSGDLRFLVTMLAFMNEVPILLNPVEPKGSFTAGGKMQSYFTHRTVSVNIPAIRHKQRRGMIAKIMAKAVKNHKRAHRVRAHVRRYFRDGMLYKQTTVKAHQRGNAALGWVHQDYEVTAK